MTTRIPNLHIGDTVRVFTYEGAKLNTHSTYFHEIGEDRLGERVFTPLNADADGLRFVGTYIGFDPEGNKLRFQILAQNPGFAYTVPAEIGTVDPRVTASRADLIIPERLIRRYQILEPALSSSILPLEEVVEETAK